MCLEQFASNTLPQWFCLLFCCLKAALKTHLFNIIFKLFFSQPCLSPHPTHECVNVCVCVCVCVVTVSVIVKHPVLPPCAADGHSRLLEVLFIIIMNQKQVSQLTKDWIQLYCGCISLERPTCTFTLQQVIQSSTIAHLHKLTWLNCSYIL